MEAFIVIILFAVFVLVWRFRPRKAALTAAATYHQKQFEASAPRSLFDDPAEHAAFAQAETLRLATAQRAAFRVRAVAGDLSVLPEALAFDGVVFYRELLDLLVRHTADVSALVQYLAQNSHWRGSPHLAETLLSRWQARPDQYALGEVLHFAALSDDAAVFQQTVCATLTAWRQGQLTWASPHNLRALIESEYWLLSPEARRTGAGFLLKRMLVEVRRELAAATASATSR